MNWNEQCAAIIPCHNEARHLAAVIAGARKALTKVIVVDDGSTDDTAKIAEAHGAICVRHLLRQGKGAALLAGFKCARAMGFNWVITLDGDGQHAPEEMTKFFHNAELTGAALIVGNRMPQAQHMPPLRRAVNRLMSRWLSHHTGRPLPDSQCGFRLLRLDAFPQTVTTTHKFEFESEMLVILAQCGERIEFVPISVIYKNERSKIRAFSDTWRWLNWWRTLPRPT